MIIHGKHAEQSSNAIHQVRWSPHLTSGGSNSSRMYFLDLLARSRTRAAWCTAARYSMLSYLITIPGIFDWDEGRVCLVQNVIDGRSVVGIDPAVEDG